ncbi:MAG TPA: DNA/RNA nuclease SfsA, partial [Myxococcales bacterium]|nr:DNA/RNA nuclease SfsA [Myxococcales bacterium]
MSVFVPFAQPIRQGRLVRRYKRFLADIVLEDGTEIVAHCANTGSMRGLTEPGSSVLVWQSDNPKRKLKWSWKAVQATTGSWVGIDTTLPNRFVAEAVAAGEIATLAKADEVKREQKMGANSRVDIVVTGDWGRAWVEVKNVTLVDSDERDVATGLRVARFP